jgi:hypothetical protein
MATTTASRNHEAFQPHFQSVSGQLGGGLLSGGQLGGKCLFYKRSKKSTIM